MNDESPIGTSLMPLLSVAVIIFNLLLLVWLWRLVVQRPQRMMEWADAGIDLPTVSRVIFNVPTPIFLAAFLVIGGFVVLKEVTIAKPAARLAINLVVCVGLMTLAAVMSMAMQLPG